MKLRIIATLCTAALFLNGCVDSSAGNTTPVTKDDQVKAIDSNTTMNGAQKDQAKQAVDERAAINRANATGIMPNGQPIPKPVPGK